MSGQTLKIGTSMLLPWLTFII